MTTKAGAVYEFLSGFGVPAYAATAVPAEAEMPYLTYELSTGAFGDGEQSVVVNLWYLTESEALPNAKAQEISERVGRKGVFILCEGGSVWIKRGVPFSQSVDGEGDDNAIKRRYINLSVEYLTED